MPHSRETGLSRDEVFSKTEEPANNPLYQASLDTMDGLSQYTDKNIQVAYMLSITCWGEQCYSSNPLFANDTTERLTQNSYVLDHMQAIADHYNSDPSQFFIVDGKPLLLVYISQGSNVYLYNPAGPQYKTLAFNGPGNITPTTSDWNPQITVNGSPVNVRDFFSVRFAVVAQATFDYTSYGTDIWPFTCMGSDCTFSEVGYAALYSPAWGNRSISNFDRLVSEATSASKPYILVRSWNEFSSTDEYEGHTWTLEPNTELASYDGSPGANPWYFYNLVMQELNSVKGYQIVSQNSGLCLDVVGVSKSPGAQIQQYTCLGQGQANQIWELVPQTTIPATGPLSYEVISKNSQMCLTVPGNSQSNGSLMEQEPCTGASGQLWNLLIPSGATHYELQPQSSSSNPQECLDVVGASTNPGALVQQYQCLGATQTNQIWSILWNGTTEYTPPPVGQ